MPNLGNAWHIPANPEPRTRGGMRDPVGAIVPGTAVTIITGNQFQGAGGNPGNQLQDGSSVFFRRRGAGAWTEVPMLFQLQADNNKYYAAAVPTTGLQAGDVIQYYLRLPYSDHDTTFLRAKGAASAATADEKAARRAPFAFTLESSAVRGVWGPVFALPNVAVHASLLPNGLVLLWGRRDGPDDSLDVHVCTPQLWDPATGAVTATDQPEMSDGKTTINLFCSGHTFLPDGRLFVAGGHLLDSQGLNQACIYDPVADTWTPTSLMNNGRWYPTATTLPDGHVLVTSGSFLAGGTTPNNQVPQVWRDGTWTSLASLPNGATFELYPRMHLTSAGEVFMCGPLAQTWLFTPANGGRWRTVGPRKQARRDYAPSVMYARDKVLYIGGGNDQGSQQPTAAAETIDLRAAAPAWKPTSPMHFRRRQHNATILADGTVLVTGGTRGGGGPGAQPGFNDLGAGQPVHTAELWDPATGTWSELAAESVDRCYHATAVLLPDATVLSAGGGEYRPTNEPNEPVDSHRDGQVFSPPYLFKGPRPVIAWAPASVSHGQTFEVATEQSADIGKVTFIRLSSVTHSCNMSQSINVLAFRAKAGGLTVTAPASPNECPPGHYLLFVLTKKGVPSVAAMVRMHSSAVENEGISPAGGPAVAADMTAAAPPPLDALAARALIVDAQEWSPVVVGVLGTCPYGIGACWGGAHEALATLEGVQAVDPIPDADNSTANVYLEADRLPPLRRWEEQFGRVVNGSYTLRGVEMTVEGTLGARRGELFLDAEGNRPRIFLRPLGAASKIQWNRTTASPRAPEPQEANAYQNLAAAPVEHHRVTVTGPLEETDSGYLLEVRVFTV